METIDIWNKFDLSRTKIVLSVFFLLLLTSASTFGQARRFGVNNPRYDEKPITYGFLIGLHTTAYQLKYSDRFVDIAQDSTLYDIQPTNSIGFSLGFIVNMKVAEYLDLRLLPTVAFYEHELIYNFDDGTEINNPLKETTMVEFPVMLKYKSVRRKNSRMYFVGGVKPAFQASARTKEDDEGSEILPIDNFNLSMDVGFGLDLYFPLFKFSPELRFSKGVLNSLNGRNNLTAGIERLNTNTISLFLLFQ